MGLYLPLQPGGSYGHQSAVGLCAVLLVPLSLWSQSSFNHPAARTHHDLQAPLHP